MSRLEGFVRGVVSGTVRGIGEGVAGLARSGVRAGARALTDLVGGGRSAPSGGSVVDALEEERRAVRAEQDALREAAERRRADAGRRMEGAVRDALALMAAEIGGPGGDLLSGMPFDPEDMDYRDAGEELAELDSAVRRRIRRAVAASFDAGLGRAVREKDEIDALIRRISRTSL